MTQGLEQYHLTHLKISLIYLLNLRYKVLKYKVFDIQHPMARPFRIEYAVVTYHITSRGNTRQQIFKKL